MSKTKLNMSQQVMGIVANHEVFMSGNMAYIMLEKTKAKLQAVPIASNIFTEWLNAKVYDATKNFPQRKDLEGVQNCLSHKARNSEITKSIYSRFASVNNSYYLDLGLPEMEAARISGGRWEIITDHGLLFNREPAMRALPMPSGGSDPLQLLEYLNIHDKKQQLLVLAWIVSALDCDIEHPILLLQGGPASGKTTAGEFIRSLLDPADPLYTSMPSREEELALIFSKNPMVFIDNCSAMSQGISDMYCKAVTGCTYSKRQLYTDFGVVHYNFKRPIIITSINMPNSRADFLSRCLHIPMHPIPSSKKLSELNLKEQFNDKLPQLLSSLLNLAAETFNIRNNVRLGQSTRMADFDRIGCAVANVLGWNPSEFMDMRLEMERESAIEPKLRPFCAALQEVLEDHGGRATMQAEELARNVSERLSDFEEEISPHQLGRRMELNKSTLESMDIMFSKKKKKDGIYYELHGSQKQLNTQVSFVSNSSNCVSIVDNETGFKNELIDSCLNSINNDEINYEDCMNSDQAIIEEEAECFALFNPTAEKYNEELSDTNNISSSELKHDDFDLESIIDSVLSRDII